MKNVLDFYKNKRVLITGHTGFKGSWMCKVLLMAGAEVTGYALEAPTYSDLFNKLSLENQMKSIVGDIRNLSELHKIFEKINPEIVIHMAAQPIVRASYNDPVYTYDVNVMGTVNVLECIRLTDSVRSFINVTTDKVYKNKEWEWGYRENEELNGYDPYSNSKSCSELATESYKNSFFLNRDIAITTMRAGNVIGGGDYAVDRIIPDCVRSAVAKKDIIVRNPYSIRPYQHVLEAVMAYLMVASEQYIDTDLAGNYNVGPEEYDCVSTSQLVDIFCYMWEKETGQNVNWISRCNEGPHEANFLRLDCSKLKKKFNWKPVWDIKEAIKRSIQVYNSQCSIEVIERQILDYIEEYHSREA